MSTLLPRTSAAFSYSSELIHEDVGKFYAYILLSGPYDDCHLRNLLRPISGELVPDLNHPTGLKLTALSVLTLFLYHKSVWVSKQPRGFKNVLCVILIAGILCFVLCGLGKVNFREFFPANPYLPEAPARFYSAVSTFILCGRRFLHHHGLLTED